MTDTIAIIGNMANTNIRRIMMDVADDLMEWDILGIILPYNREVCEGHSQVLTDTTKIIIDRRRFQLDHSDELIVVNASNRGISNVMKDEIYYMKHIRNKPVTYLYGDPDTGEKQYEMVYKPISILAKEVAPLHKTTPDIDEQPIERPAVVKPSKILQKPLIDPNGNVVDMDRLKEIIADIYGDSTP